MHELHNPGARIELHRHEQARIAREHEQGALIREARAATRAEAALRRSERRARRPRRVFRFWFAGRAA